MSQSGPNTATKSAPEKSRTTIHGTTLKRRGQITNEINTMLDKLCTALFENADVASATPPKHSRGEKFAVKLRIPTFFKFKNYFTICLVMAMPTAEQNVAGIMSSLLEEAQHQTQHLQQLQQITSEQQKSPLELPLPRRRKMEHHRQRFDMIIN